MALDDAPLVSGIVSTPMTWRLPVSEDLGMLCHRAGILMVRDVAQWPCNLLFLFV